MRAKAVVRILRVNQIFHTGEAKIDRTFNSDKGQGKFPGFQKPLIEALYRKENQCDGEVAAYIFELSQGDEDFFPDGKWLIWFPREFEIEAICESFSKTDQTTHSILKRSWAGVRPVVYLEDILR